MVIDYMIQFPCEVRRQVSDASLQGMLKSKRRAEFAIDQVRRVNPSLDPDDIKRQWKLGVLMSTPEGATQSKEVPIGEVLAQAARLDPLALHCKNCPANVNGPRFGCIGAIDYPISKATEQWLLARLPKDCDDERLKLLLKLIADLSIDGAPVDSQRLRRDAYQLGAPLVRKWGGPFSRKTISSSQIIHMLVMMGDLDPAVTTLFSQLLDFRSITRCPSGDGEPGIGQFESFMAAAIVAAERKARLLVDA